MRKGLTGLAVVVASLVVAMVAAGAATQSGPNGGSLAASSTAGARRSVYYLALGDSVPVWNGPDSYPNQILASSVTKKIPHLQLVNLACSSETTTTMLLSSLCGGSQYQKALAFLAAHRGHVALVTIDIGGNDVVSCVTAIGIDFQCALAALATIQRNLSTMLAGIRSAVGPEVPIVGMNYYDPFLGEWLDGPGGQTLATTSVNGLVILNTLLAQIYAKGGAKLADVQGAFRSTDLTDLVSSQWGMVPVAVERACTLLDIVCVVGQPEGFGDDPNVAGATVIAHVFEDVIGVLQRPHHIRR